jgi:hypothetical protein
MAGGLKRSDRRQRYFIFMGEPVTSGIALRPLKRCTDLGCIFFFLLTGDMGRGRDTRQRREHRDARAAYEVVRAK